MVEIFADAMISGIYFKIICERDEVGVTEIKQDGL